MRESREKKIGLKKEEKKGKIRVPLKIHLIKMAKTDRWKCVCQIYLEKNWCIYSESNFIENQLLEFTLKNLAMIDCFLSKKTCSWRGVRWNGLKFQSNLNKNLEWNHQKLAWYHQFQGFLVILLWIFEEFLLRILCLSSQITSI